MMLPLLQKAEVNVDRELSDGGSVQGFLRSKSDGIWLNVFSLPPKERTCCL